MCGLEALQSVQYITIIRKGEALTATLVPAAARFPLPYEGLTFAHIFATTVGGGPLARPCGSKSPSPTPPPS